MKGYDKRSSPEPLVEQIDKLQDRILILSKEIGQGLAHLNVDFRGDQWIKRSYQHLLALLHDLTIALNGNDWLLSGDRLPHPMTFEEMSLYPSEFASAVSFDAASWRASLREGAAKALTAEDLKDVFDIYFRYDLYGRFRRPDTIFLNRGISDPWYFAPPAGVSLALDVANERNWFGYSDPLGHIATRESVAALERHRRRQPGITFENIAITQGATHTLTSLLNLLAWRGLRGKIVVPVPNYPPLVDQISHHFGIERLALSKDYGCEPAEIRHRVLRPDVVAVLLAYPHNPTTNGSLYQEVVELARLCSETNRYLIIIENAFSDLVSGNLDPIRFPNTIIISSWSKTYGTAGLSVGHIVADRKMIDLFYRYASSAYGSPPSFLYLTCTTLAMLELGHRLGTTNRFERELDETLSSPLLLFREFGHWCEAQGLRSEFSDMILKLVMNIRCFDSLKSVQSDPIVSSVNRVLQTRLEGSNYSTFLSVLAGKNVSVLPVDCLTPPDDRHDLRVTIALAPSELIHGVTATCEELDNLYAKQQQVHWLHPDDKIWLERAGLFSLDARLNFWGHLRRVRLRFQEIAGGAGFAPPVYLSRAAALHDLGKVWSLLDPERARKEWSKISEDHEDSCPLPLALGEIAIARSLLGMAAELSLPPLPSELIALLNAFFGDPDVAVNLFPWPSVLDLADKTSDFRMTEPIGRNALARCLRLKSMQLRLRYPEKEDEIEREFTRSRKNLAEIFPAAQTFA